MCDAASGQLREAKSKSDWAAAGSQCRDTFSVPVDAVSSRRYSGVSTWHRKSSTLYTAIGMITSVVILFVKRLGNLHGYAGDLHMTGASDMPGETQLFLLEFVETKSGPE
jgi:hypothetical protein